MHRRNGQRFLMHFLYLLKIEEISVIFYTLVSVCIIIFLLTFSSFSILMHVVGFSYYSFSFFLL